MSNQNRGSSVFIPTTLNEALNILNTHKDALVISGGTYLLKDQNTPRFKFPPKVLSIEKIPELKKITRTESHLEIGSGVSIQSILDLGNNIPPLLYNTLIAACPDHIKPRATMGGNICVKNRRLTSFPTLSLLETRLELRNSRSSRWLPFYRFLDADNKLALKPNELLTRIRIPYKQKGRSFFRRYGPTNNPSEDSFVFAGILEKQDNTITKLKLAFSDYSSVFYRNREMEASFVGRRIPFSAKDKEILLEILRNLFKEKNEKILDYYIELAYMSVLLFLEEISEF